MLSLSDRNTICSTEKRTNEWLRKIENSGLDLPARAATKTDVAPNNLCFFNPNECSERSGEKSEQAPPSFTMGFYIRSDQLQHPFFSVVKEFKVMKCRVAILLRHSRDALVRGTAQGNNQRRLQMGSQFSGD